MSYTLEWRVKAGPGATTQVTGITDLFYDLSGLEPSTEYEFRVKEVDGLDESAYSDWYTITTAYGVPDKPTIDFLVGLDTEIVFTWEGSAREDGETYEAEARRQDLTGAVVTGSGLTPLDGATISGLEPETIYEIRVRVTNSAGTSEWSDWVAAETRPMLSAPINLGWVEDGEDSVVTWTDPNSYPPGPPLPQYEVDIQILVLPTPGWVSGGLAEAQEEFFALGFAPPEGDQFRFRVKAAPVPGVYESPYSEWYEFSATTPAATKKRTYPHALFGFLPAVAVGVGSPPVVTPTGLSGVVLAGDSISWTWDDVPSVLGYRIKARKTP